MKNVLFNIILWGFFPAYFVTVYFIEESRIDKKIWNKSKTELQGILYSDKSIHVRIPGSMCSWIVDKNGDGTPEYTKKIFGAPRRGFFSIITNPSNYEDSLFKETFCRLSLD